LREIAIGEIDNEFNDFYRRFDAQDFNEISRDFYFSLKTEEYLHIDKGSVLRVLQTTQKHKSPGLDKVSGRVLRSCADQLCDISHFIFQTSVKLQRVPSVPMLSPMLYLFD